MISLEQFGPADEAANIVRMIEAGSDRPDAARGYAAAGGDRCVFMSRWYSAAIRASASLDAHTRGCRTRNTAGRKRRSALKTKKRARAAVVFSGMPCTLVCRRGIAYDASRPLVP